jgi:RimJ/RimL family protein N-acetyltransferase
VTVEPLDPDRHAEPLFRAMESSPAKIWTYTPYGPFADTANVAATIRSMLQASDWQPYAVVVDRQPLGFATYLRIKPGDGAIEVGGIAFSPPLQRTTAATESLYLLINNAFDLGYRRCEWKCDDLNSASRLAAERLGFRFEGTFVQATHYKGRNRDTAWYAITDREWPRLEAALQAWLSPDNFDPAGQQRNALREYQARI